MNSKKTTAEAERIRSAIRALQSAPLSPDQRRRGVEALKQGLARIQGQSQA